MVKIVRPIRLFVSPCVGLSNNNVRLTLEQPLFHPKTDSTSRQELKNLILKNTMRYG
jgi:hypothetical protein